MSIPEYKNIREEYFNKQNMERESDIKYINIVAKNYYMDKITELINNSKKDIINEKLSDKIYIRNSDVKKLNNPESVCTQMQIFLRTAGYNNIVVTFEKTFYNSVYCNLKSIVY